MYRGRTKRNSKEKNQRYHAKIRMLQHYGIQLTNLDLEKMAEIYRHNPDVAILYRQSNRVVKAVIPYNGAVYPIVYDKTRHQIVTILKEEYLTPRQKKIFEACKARLVMSQSNVGNNIVIPENLPVESNKEEIEEGETEEDMEMNNHVDYRSEEENQRLMEEAFGRLPNS